MFLNFLLFVPFAHGECKVYCAALVVLNLTFMDSKTDTIERVKEYIYKLKGNPV